MMLKGEFDAHMDYEKHQKARENNIRNGHSKKKMSTSWGFGNYGSKRPR